MVYTNGEESNIWAGNEKRTAVVFLSSDELGNNLLDKTDDINSSLTTDTMVLSGNLIANGDMETAATGWTAIDGGTTTNEQSTDFVHSGTYSWKIIVAANDDGIDSDAFTMDGSSVYTVTAWVYSAAETNVAMEVLDGDASSLDDTNYPITAGQWNKISVNVTSAASGAGALVRFNASTGGAGTFYFDDVTCVKQGANTNLIVLTTRPAQGFKFYVSGANGTASTMTAKYWSGSAWTAVGSGSDGTAAGGITLAATGTYSFDDTVSVAKPKHFEELFLYAYMFTISAGSATIYHMTTDANWMAIKDVWDGVYRQPIQFQAFSTDHFEDFTLQVNESSDVNTPVGGQLDGLVTGTDHVITMFEDQTAGMRWTMLGDLINAAAAVMTVYYWNGIAWAAVSGLTDGTVNAAGTKSLTQTGLIHWTTPTDEQKQTLFGTVGYAYKIEWDGTLTGTKGSTVEVMVDLVYGVPTQNTVDPFDFSVLYKNRVMLGSFSAGNQRNRMDYCAANAPDVWNGFDSSDDGRYSLYFGNEDKITSAVQLYNRFGSNIFSMLLVLKEGETYVMTGDTPDDFQIFPVSLNTGCPAPLTLATAEMGFESGSGIQRQVALWVSHSGPMMFDGAVMQPLRGVDLYFDPTETEFVNWAKMASTARGWVDHTYREYNLLIPSTSAQTTNNIWLVYDLIRKKWFRKATGSASFPQSAWTATYTTGRQAVIAGFYNGKIGELEVGTSWGSTYADQTSGSGIQQDLKTGDFFPANNIWDNCLLRKFKIICEKISSTLTVELNINYYENSANSASNVIFEDQTDVDFTDMDADSDGTKEVIWASAASTALQLDLDVGTDRLTRLIQDLNQLGWSHSFEFSVTTTDVQKGWKPIAWGVRYRVERKDDTAT
jgi:hypothetical protein